MQGILDWRQSEEGRVVEKVKADTAVLSASECCKSGLNLKQKVVVLAVHRIFKQLQQRRVKGRGLLHGTQVSKNIQINRLISYLSVINP